MRIESLIEKVANQLLNLERLRKSYPVIYHKTPLHNAVKIIQSNSLKGLGNSISMTRDKDLNIKYLAYPEDSFWVRFSFNVESLMKGRRFIKKRPYDDFHGDGLVDEQEERIYDKRLGLLDHEDSEPKSFELSNISNSIISIDMEQGTYDRLMGNITLPHFGKFTAKVPEKMYANPLSEHMSGLSVDEIEEAQYAYLHKYDRSSLSYHAEGMLDALEFLQKEQFLPNGYTKTLMKLQPEEVWKIIRDINAMLVRYDRTGVDAVLQHPKFRVIKKF